MKTLYKDGCVCQVNNEQLALLKKDGWSEEAPAAPSETPDAAAAAKAKAEAEAAAKAKAEAEAAAAAKGKGK